MRAILNSALENLITTAKKQKFIEPPYGRKPEPTPIMTENEFLEQKDDLDDDAHFKFDYGFNPLRMLATHMKRFHPDAVLARREERERSMEWLHGQALEAQARVAREKQEAALKEVQASGIVYGPVVVPVDVGQVRIMVKAAAEGDVILELSQYDAFQTIALEQQMKATAKDGFVVIFSVDKLQQGVRYFARCVLKGNDYREHYPAPVPVDEPTEADATGEIGTADAATEAASETTAAAAPPVATPTYIGRDSGVFQKTSFWSYIPDVLPESSIMTAQASMDAAEAAPTNGAAADAAAMPAQEDEATGAAPAEAGEEGPSAPPPTDAKTPSGPSPITLVGACLTPLRGDEEAPRTVGPALPIDLLVPRAQDDPLFTAILGDVFASGPSHMVEHRAFYDGGAIAFHHENACVGPNPMELFRNGATFLGWNDGQLGSDVALKAEEIVHRQHLSDVKHWTRKYKDNGGNSKRKGKSRSSDKKEVPPEPEFTRPPASIALSALASTFPVAIASEDSSATRNIYHAYFLSNDVQVISLDMRGGYIGKQQARWLRSMLTNSLAHWKIILCGACISATDASSNAESTTEGAVNSETEATAARVSVKTDDTGEYGWATSSIEHMLCKLQSDAIAEAGSEDAGAASVDASIDAATSVAVTSGIVFLSAGRNAGYVTHLNPLAAGNKTAFAAEVCCGSALARQPPAGINSAQRHREAQREKLVMKENLVAQDGLIWSGGAGVPTVGVLKYHHDGTLDVSVTDAVGGDVLFSTSFVR